MLPVIDMEPFLPAIRCRPRIPAKGKHLVGTPRELDKVLLKGPYPEHIPDGEIPEFPCFTLCMYLKLAILLEKPGFRSQVIEDEIIEIA